MSKKNPYEDITPNDSIMLTDEGKKIVLQHCPLKESQDGFVSSFISNMKDINKIIEAASGLNDESAAALNRELISLKLAHYNATEFIDYLEGYIEHIERVYFDNNKK